MGHSLLPSFMLQLAGAHRLHRYYGAGHLDFITTSCYRRRPLLGSGHSRDLFLDVLEQVRRRYHFVVIGYVVMPEHVICCSANPNVAIHRW